jgi:carbon-monoxide dehydrogenase large subunit
VIDNGKQIAAHLLEAGRGRHRIRAAASPSSAPTAASASWSWRERLRGGMKLPDGVPATLDVSHVHGSRALGLPQRLPCRRGRDRSRHRRHPRSCATPMVNDFGTVINPMLVEGQAHGGVVQGIGQALMERVVYDEDGQPLTGSFMDYALPRAATFRRASLRRSSGAGHDQSAGRQGLRRGRLRRRAALGDERRGRRRRSA